MLDNHVNSNIENKPDIKLKINNPVCTDNDSNLENFISGLKDIQKYEYTTNDNFDNKFKEQSIDIELKKDKKLSDYFTSINNDSCDGNNDIVKDQNEPNYNGYGYPEFK
jgi:hypothetical protein